MKRIQLTVARLLAEDKKFYHNMLKLRLRKSRRAERSIARTLTKLILEEAGYTAPNPAERITPEMGLDEMLVELFNTQVYERMKSNAAIGIHPERGIGRDFGVEITLDRDANPNLYDCYEAFSKLVLYTAEQDRKIESINSRIAETGSDIERAGNSLPRLERERDDLDARLKAKIGKRKPKINGLTTELENKRAAIMQTGRTEKGLILKQKELNSEKEQAENERNCSQRYFLSGIAGSAASAGLSELEAAARKMAGDGNKAAVSRDLITYLDKNFTEAITQNVICGMDFPKKAPFIWPQWARITGAVAAAGGAAVLAAALGLFGGTRSSSQQVIDDYQRFRRGQLTAAELDERYPQGTEEFGILLKTMIKDGYLKTGSKINLNGTQFELVSEIGNPRPEEIVEEEEWTGRGMERDGSRWKPVLPPGAKARAAGKDGGIHRYKDMNTGHLYEAVTRIVPPDFKGKLFYSLKAGEKVDFDMGTVSYAYNVTKDHKIWVTYAEEGNPAMILELIVDEEAGKVSPIWPLRTGPVTCHVNVVAENTDGVRRIEKYRLDILEDEERRIRHVCTRFEKVDEESGMVLVPMPRVRDGKSQVMFEGSQQYVIDLGNHAYETPREEEQAPLIMTAEYNTVPPQKGGMMPLEIAFDKKNRRLTPLPPSAAGLYMLAVRLQDAAGNEGPPLGFVMRVADDGNGAVWYGVKPGDPKIQRRMNARRATPPEKDVPEQ